MVVLTDVSDRDMGVCADVSCEVNTSDGVIGPGGDGVHGSVDRWDLSRKDGPCRGPIANLNS